MAKSEVQSSTPGAHPFLVCRLLPQRVLFRKCGFEQKAVPHHHLRLLHAREQHAAGRPLCVHHHVLSLFILEMALPSFFGQRLRACSGYRAQRKRQP